MKNIMLVKRITIILKIIRIINSLRNKTNHVRKFPKIILWKVLKHFKLNYNLLQKHIDVLKTLEIKSST